MQATKETKQVAQWPKRRRRMLRCKTASQIAPRVYHLVHGTTTPVSLTALCFREVVRSDRKGAAEEDRRFFDAVVFVAVANCQYGLLGGQRRVKTMQMGETGGGGLAGEGMKRASCGLEGRKAVNEVGRTVRRTSTCQHRRPQAETSGRPAAPRQPTASPEPAGCGRGRQSARRRTAAVLCCLLLLMVLPLPRCCWPLLELAHGSSPGSRQ